MLPIACATYLAPMRPAWTAWATRAALKRGGGGDLEDFVWDPIHTGGTALGGADEACKLRPLHPAGEDWPGPVPKVVLKQGLGRGPKRGHRLPQLPPTGPEDVFDAPGVVGQLAIGATDGSKWPSPTEEGTAGPDGGPGHTFGS